MSRRSSGAASATMPEETADTLAPAAASTNTSTSTSSFGKKTILKLILLGQAGTGKTSLLNRFVDDTWHSTYKATLGSDLREVETEVGGEQVMLQIWDTAGQERFHSLTNLFLKGASCVILVYDLTRADSFDALNLWRDQFLSSTRNDPATFPFAVLANKSDMAANRAVSQRKANNWCATHGDIPYTECSAKESTNVHQAIMALVRRTMKQIQDERQAEHEAFAVQPPPNVLLTDRNAGRSGGGGRRTSSAGAKSEKGDGKSSCCA